MFLFLVATSGDLILVTTFINKYVHDYSIVDRLLVYSYFWSKT
jgi:hypothetical protein